MNHLERFQTLAQQARLEPAPSLDVTRRVLSRLQSAERAGRVDWILPLLTGLSAAAAVVVAVLALDAWNVLASPVAGIFSPLAW